MEGGENREHAHPVGDEVRRVLGADHTLAERGGEEPLQRIEHVRLRFARRDQLHQVHIARRVEEMHTAEAPAQCFRHRLRQGVDRQTGGVAGEYGLRRQERRDLVVERFLDVDALGDRLDHQIALAQLLQMLIIVGRFDEGCLRRARERTGLELPQAVDGLRNIAVGIALLGRKLEQHGRHVGVDQVGSDLRAHDAGAEHGDLVHMKGRTGGHLDLRALDEGRGGRALPPPWSFRTSRSTGHR